MASDFSSHHSSVLTQTCLLLALFLTFLTCPTAVRARRVPEHHCQGGGTPGDKWFDGCQWCVCTTRGKVCSQSQCSTGLVRKVPPCHVLGQRWTDGCYQCRCKRHGIACRLDDTCLLLRHNPVPCLADDRCVCGPDGVPSCTAEVIDRRAFSAKRVDIDLSSALLEPEMEVDDSHMRTSGLPPASTTQELLITSDNLCRFGPRWYGGSLRCFCDMDGSITCGNPAFVTAFFDDFRVRHERCEEGHAWEETCAVCSCRVNGIVFCRRDQQCRARLLNNDDDEEYDVPVDHFIPGVNDDEYDETEDTMMLPQAPAITHPPPRAAQTKWKGEDKEECEPGVRWREGCKRCRCTNHGRVVCHERRCQDNGSKNGGVGADDDEEDIDNSGRQNPHDRGLEDEERKDGKFEQSGDGEPWGKPTDESGNKPTGEREEDDPWNKPPPDSNHAHETPSTGIKPPFTPHGPRGPMMMVPIPHGGAAKPPAYAAPWEHKYPCGPFKVGEKYWDKCNLCLCTLQGPKCEGKLCR